MQGKEPRPYTLEDYNQVTQLRKEGLTFQKIAEIIGVSHATAILWVNTHRKPRCIYAKSMQRKLPESAKKLSPELAYIYGVLIGDGSLELSHSYRVNLNVNDKDFAYAFAEALKKWSNLKPTINKRKVFGNHQTKYGDWIRTDNIQHVVRLGSKQAVEFLLSNVECRTYDWQVPKSVLDSKNEIIKGNFLKGFYDSEGSVIYDKKYNNKRIDLMIFKTTGIKDIQMILSELGIKSILKNEKHGMCLLRIIGKNNLRLFLDKINFTIFRKRNTLEKALNSYIRDAYDGEKVRKDILNSIKNHPKTIREISSLVGKHFNTVNYHLKNLKRMRKIKAVERITRDKIHYSRLWK